MESIIDNFGTFIDNFENFYVDMSTNSITILGEEISLLTIALGGALLLVLFFAITLD